MSAPVIVGLDTSQDVLFGSLFIGVFAAVLTTVAAVVMGQSIGVLVIAYLGPLFLAVALGVIFNLSRQPLGTPTLSLKIL
ncbi:MAG: hypothetical protein JWS10_1052 [Cypionkella sp.]|uniref:hypothetical protein n=1 Tax=Cypionkella sp. TaxID=2811411 RepID=UPI00260946EB|nr:hypothetical protein [Cypionkella sp.]MDB5658437.1 hypothetical protein [Cypionkella sp.]